jgi:hypothetical protein
MTKPRSLSENFDLLLHPSKFAPELKTEKYSTTSNTALAQSRAKAAQAAKDKAALEGIALANQRGLLSESTAGDTEFTDKQIAKFIKKEADIAKQLIEEIGQSTKLQLNSLSSEQLSIENQFKNNQISINSYYEKRLEFARKELDINLQKNKLEQGIIKAEADRVEHYQNIQLDNDKDVVKLQKLKDRMTSYNLAVSGGFSQFEGRLSLPKKRWQT